MQRRRRRAGPSTSLSEDRRAARSAGPRRRLHRSRHEKLSPSPLVLLVPAPARVGRRRARSRDRLRGRGHAGTGRRRVLLPGSRRSRRPEGARNERCRTPRLAGGPRASVLLPAGRRRDAKVATDVSPAAPGVRHTRVGFRPALVLFSWGLSASPHWKTMGPTLSRRCRGREWLRQLGRSRRGPSRDDDPCVVVDGVRTRGRRLADRCAPCPCDRRRSRRPRLRPRLAQRRQAPRVRLCRARRSRPSRSCTQSTGSATASVATGLPLLTPALRVVLGRAADPRSRSFLDVPESPRVRRHPVEDPEPQRLLRGEAPAHELHQVTVREQSRELPRLSGRFAVDGADAEQTERPNSSA